MNRDNSDDLGPPAPGLLCYRLLDVRTIRDAPQSPSTERRFVETDTRALLLSNAHGGQLVIDGRIRVLRPGDLFVCRPGQLIELTNYSGQPLELLLLSFAAFGPSGEHPGMLTAVPADAPLPLPAEAQISPASLAGQLYGAICAGWRSGAPSDRLRCEAGLLELLGLALHDREQRTELALEAARLELERRYADELTIDELAGIAGLSRYHFMRLFKERYGRGVIDYRTELRLRAAKRLMREPGGPALGEIVYRVGYKNESYFSSLFKKQTGVAPAVYQRNQKRRIAAYSWINIGQLLALQTIPLAAPMDQYWTDRYRNRYDCEVTTRLSHQYEFNLAALRAARPDRIVGIGAFIPEAEQDRLREVAPALFLDWAADWRGHLRSVAGFLELEAEAAGWLDRYDRRAQEVRERVGRVVGADAVLMLSVGGQGVSVCGRRAGTLLYDDLGCAVPSGLGQDWWARPIEPEELAGIGADRMLVRLGQDEAARTAWERLTRADTWRDLPAVREGKVHARVHDGFFAAPVNEYAAEPLSRALLELAEWLGDEPPSAARRSARGSVQWR
ncbi:helix-turn-helix domain-containing protein [Cohnella sp. 56]|uniref:helix-turn-helix domain-containing protein n=1 Tax=Cohnella sp. 56 TaxID=3113722 RepID=UPI0030E84FB1